MGCTHVYHALQMQLQLLTQDSKGALVLRDHFDGKLIRPGGSPKHTRALSWCSHTASACHSAVLGESWPCDWKPLPLCVVILPTDLHMPLQA